MSGDLPYLHCQVSMGNGDILYIQVGFLHGLVFMQIFEGLLRALSF